jgi:hypothetical protein
MGGILAIKLNSILEVSAGSIKKVGPSPKYQRSNTNVTPLYISLTTKTLHWTTFENTLHGNICENITITETLI